MTIFEWSHNRWRWEYVGHFLFFSKYDERDFDRGNKFGTPISIGERRSLLSFQSNVFGKRFRACKACTGLVCLLDEKRIIERPVHGFLQNCTFCS